MVYYFIFVLILFLPARDAGLCNVESNVEVRLRQTESGFYTALVCYNYRILHEDSIELLMSQHVVPDGVVIFRESVIYLNDVMVSKIPNIFRLSFENCKVFSSQHIGINENRLFSLHIFNSTVIMQTDNWASGFTNLHNFYSIENKFSNPEIESSFFGNLKLYRIVFSNCHLTRMFTKYVNEEFVYLEVDGNDLTEAISYNSSMMDSYNFASNKLSQLPSSLDIFQEDKTLRTLNVSSNLIKLDIVSHQHFQTLIKLQVLDMSKNPKIRSISKDTFKYCQNLQHLNISNCGLESLDNLGIQSLETLDLSQNLLKEIPEDVLRNQINLTRLSLDNNSLTSLPKFDTSQLTFLNLSNNMLKSFVLNYDLQSLEIIDLSFNQLEEIQDFWSLRKVSEIFLQHNRLKFIFCGNNLPNSLKILDISYNKILTFTSDIFSKLNSLKLTNTRVSIQFSENLDSQISIDIQDFLRHNCHESESDFTCENFQLNEADLTYFSIAQQHLSLKKVVTFRNCKIQFFNVMLISILPQASEFRLEDCNVRMMNFKGSERIADQNQLESLVFKNSTLSLEFGFDILKKLPNLKSFKAIDTTFYYQLQTENLFVNNNYLEQITIENTNLQTFLPAGPNLKHLKLKGNRLKKVHDLDAKKLSTLDLSNNLLSSFPSSLDDLSGQNQLIELNLSGNTIIENELSRHHFKDFPKLQKLDLSNNTKIQFLGHEVFIFLSSLKSVNLSKTGLKALDTMGSEQLETADFSCNSIHHIAITDFNGLANLRHLNLSHNSFKALSKNIFNNLVALEMLDLSYNQIQVINRNDFNGLHRLQTLDLSSNVIEECANLATIKNLKYLYLQHNHILVIPCFQQLPQSLYIIDISHNSLAILKGSNVLHLKVHIPYELGLNASCPWSEKLMNKVSKCSSSDFLVMFALELIFYWFDFY